MTRNLQKINEKMYAEEAGKLLGESWKIDFYPNEVNFPDLKVTTAFGEFGLEVREIYQDESSRGSIKKANENSNLKKIRNLANLYYKTNCPPIKADFLGDIGNKNQLLNVITKAVGNLSTYKQKRIKPYNGCVINIERLSDNFGEYKKWNYVSDKVGWVGNIDKNVIDSAVVEKAKKIPKYAKHISDVRLLLVSNRIYNSGKAHLKNKIVCNSRGFNIVYYLSYPEEIWQLGQKGTAPI